MFRFVNEVVCGFCQGSGVDPKLGSRCPVCGSSGMICVIPPVVTCLRCCGTGRENGDLTCLACEGTGAVQVRAQAAPLHGVRADGHRRNFLLPTVQGPRRGVSSPQDNR